MTPDTPERLSPGDQNGTDDSAISAGLAVRREPWERRPDESDRAWAAFQAYRDFGSGRSLMKTARLLAETTTRRGGSVETLRTRLARWASRWQWRERVEAFELHQDRVRLEARERTRLEMEERHLGAASLMQWSAIARMRGLNTDGRQVEALDPNDIRGWDEAARLVIEGAKLERLTRGLPVDLTQALQTVPASVLIMLTERLVEAAMGLIPEEQHDLWLRIAEDTCRSLR